MIISKHFKEPKGLMKFESTKVHALEFYGDMFRIHPIGHIFVMIDFQNLFLLETHQTELLIDKPKSLYKHMGILSKILNKSYTKYQ